MTQHKDPTLGITNFVTTFAVQENINAFDMELPPECIADIEETHKKHKDPAMS